MFSRQITFFFLGALMALCTRATAQSYFWVGFTDKAGSCFSVSRPSEFLSERSVQRRLRQHIPLDVSDMPVNKSYTDSILRTGAAFVHASKWLNGITVVLSHDSLAQRIRKMSFVKEIQLTKPAPAPKSGFRKFETIEPFDGIDSSFYGPSVYQVGQLNGHYLHKNGFRGKGMLIAVLDAGFYRANQLPSLDSLRLKGQIVGTRDFVNPKSDIYAEHSHGMMVLSTMGGNLPGKLIGTAPDAAYLLLRSEDGTTEYLVEEDNWVAAAEYADSLGADIINSSLGYYTFDLPEMNHTYAQMDGKTTRVTQAANLAFKKGILVFSSAGNEGNKTWRYIISPSDGDSVVAVAAVDKYRVRAGFSSLGPAPDGNVKPDLAAMGLSTVLQNINGAIGINSGTSFSSPVLAGMAACLWQSRPAATASQVRQALIRSGSQFQRPDSLLGYGIPDMVTANLLLSQYNTVSDTQTSRMIIFPNPFSDYLTVIPAYTATSEIEITDITGKIILRKNIAGSGPVRIDGLNHLPAGIYLLRLTGNGKAEVQKLIKWDR